MLEVGQHGRTSLMPFQMQLLHHQYTLPPLPHPSLDQTV